MTYGSASSSTSGVNAERFEAFFEAWLVRQEHYLDELICSVQNCHESKEEDLKDLISRISTHYQDYYAEKARLVQNDVFLVFCASWFTPFERAFHWIAGIKPGLIIRLAKDSIDDLSEDQNQRIARLVRETKLEERGINEDYAKIQESVAAPPLHEIMKRGGGLIEGLEPLKTALRSVVANADSLRTGTSMKVMDILNAVQTLKFFVAVAQIQLKLRSCGLERLETEEAEQG